MIDLLIRTIIPDLNIPVKNWGNKGLKQLRGYKQANGVNSGRTQLIVPNKSLTLGIYPKNIWTNYD